MVCDIVVLDPSVQYGQTTNTRIYFCTHMTDAHNHLTRSFLVVDKTASTGRMQCEQVDLAVKLGLPLLAPHPSIGRHFSLKSGARQLFRSAKVNVAPGAQLEPRPLVANFSSGQCV